MRKDSLGYTDIVYQLYQASGDEIDPNDAVRRQLAAALNEFRCKRLEMAPEYLKQSSDSLFAITRAQYERLHAQVDAFTNYIAMGMAVPPNLLHACGVKQSIASTQEPDPLERINQILYYSDVIHRSLEYWGAGQFWLDYMDTLEQSRLSYCLGAVVNVRSLLQFIIRTGKLSIQVETLAKDVGLGDFVSRYRLSSGELHKEVLLAALHRLERQVKLCMTQRSLKSAIRLSRYIKPYTIQKSCYTSTCKRGIGEYGRQFAVLQRERKRQSKRNAFAAAKVFDAINKHHQIQKATAQRMLLEQLRALDEDAYSKLLHEFKRARLKDILYHTQRFMEQLSPLVVALTDKDRYVFNDAGLGGVGMQGCFAKTYKSALGFNSVANSKFNRGPARAFKSAAKNGEYMDADEGDSESDSDISLDVSIPGPWYTIDHLFKEHVTRATTSFASGELRAYQVRGLNWLLSLHECRLSAILNDGTGLGKTVQCLALLAFLKDVKGIKGPHMVVAPHFLLHGVWEPAVLRWLPWCRYVMYEGSKDWRKLERSRWYTGESDLLNFDLIMTTDSILHNDRVHFKRISFEYLIIDEPSYMMGGGYLTRALQDFDAVSRLILTGLELSQNLQVVWLVINLAFPSIFSTAENFTDWLNTPVSTGSKKPNETTQLITLSDEQQNQVTTVLYKMISPFCIRRKIEDVQMEWPLVNDNMICCPVSGIQSILHNVMISNSMNPNRNSILRKVYNHPYLICGDDAPLDELMVASCGKFVTLDPILERLYYCGHRCIIYTATCGMLDLLEMYLNYRNYSVTRLDSRLDPELRKQRVNQLNQPDCKCFCILFSSKGCSHTLIIKPTDTIIVYDGEWNMKTELCAHNIRRTSHVNVLRLVTPNTVEETTLKMQCAQQEIELVEVTSIVRPQAVSPSTVTSSRSGATTGSGGNKVKPLQKINVFGIRKIEAIDQVLVRLERDRDVISLVKLKRQLSRPGQMIQESVIPSTLLKSMITSRKFNCDQDMLDQLYKMSRPWEEIVPEYEVWTHVPLPECLVHLKRRVEHTGSGRLPLLHPVTRLDVDYPMESMYGAKSFMPQLLSALSNRLKDQRIPLVNSCIDAAFEALKNNPLLQHAMEVYVRDPAVTHDTLQPRMPQELHNLARGGSILSLWQFQKHLEHLARVVKTVKGVDCADFVLVLNIRGFLFRHIAGTLPFAVLGLVDKPKADELSFLINEGLTSQKFE